MGTTRLNILPVPTFSKLGVNFVERDISKYEPQELVIAPPYENPVRADVTGSTDIKLTAPENSSLTVILYIKPDSKLMLDTFLSASAGSRVRLVQVFEGGGQTVSRLTSELGENASLELVQLYLRGEDTVSEIVTKLAGRGSAFSAEIGCRLSGSDKLDLNLIAEHTGRRTASEISLGSVLDGSAQKTFKGTIDFKNGCGGSKGSEHEDALLMSESVKNRTVPVILCDEEDVEGSHGATIGRLDEQHIFYLGSRGLSEEKIYELMSRGKLLRTINKINDGAVKQRIFDALGWEYDD